ncbi:AI-2E family transporter [Desulfovibrio sp. OttesenSCG-928-C14]|nr:AI-2E family transporter [Desulfovibrio sp. OttesenSCG-928-C14]
MFFDKFMKRLGKFGKKNGASSPLRSIPAQPNACSPRLPGRTSRGKPRSVPSARSGPAESASSPRIFSTVGIFYFFMFAMLFLSLYLTYALAAPFLHTIILACIFSVLSHPLYKKLLPYCKNNGMLAAGVTLFILVVVICIPMVFFIIQLIPQASRTVMSLAQWLGGGHMEAMLNDTVYPILSWLHEEMPWLELDLADLQASIMSFARRAGQILLGWGTGFVVDSLNMVANFLLMLLIMFFLLKDGEMLLCGLKRLTPLHDEQKDSILNNLRRMARAVLIGGFLVAAIQGFVGGIGLAFVGIPALFWGTVMVFAALVPILGTGLVWVPAAAYLFLNGETKSAIFLVLWCGVLVTSIDSFLRPIILRGSGKTSLLFLFLSVLGGIKAFGMLGIVYGPLILSFVGVMLGIYADEYGDSLDTYKRRHRPRKISAKPEGTRPRTSVFPGRRGKRTHAAAKPEE